MWYSVSLLFKSVHVPTGPRPAVWEESIRLVEAETESEARQKAEIIGQSEKASYQARNDLVLWTFEGVERLYTIDQERLKHGVELFSRFLRDSEVESLRTPFDDE
jgi:hypothetical protein